MDDSPGVCPGRFLVSDHGDDLFALLPELGDHPRRHDPVLPPLEEGVIAHLPFEDSDPKEQTDRGERGVGTMGKRLRSSTAWDVYASQRDSVSHDQTMNLRRAGQGKRGR
jgi:hypothetical protein